MTDLNGSGQARTSNGWTIFNNAWGAGNLTYGKDYTINSSANLSNITDTAYFSWSMPTKSAVPWAQVLAYPEIAFGPSPYYNVKDPTDKTLTLPVKVGDIDGLTSNYNVNYGGNTKGYDVSYDIWYTSKPYGDASTITNEVMIWLHKGDIPAYGQLVGTYSDDSFSGKIYNTGTYTAIISDTDLTVGTVDIGAMMSKLESLGIMSSSTYLSSIQFGAEAVLGAGTLQINHFDFDLTTKNSDGVTVEKVVDGTGVSIETLTGTSGNDTIAGMSINDVINGGAGNDKITTGAGSDKIIVGTNAGHDEITDFSAANDHLELHYNGAAPTVKDTTVNGVTGTLVTAGNTSVFLDNVASGNLTNANFTKINDAPAAPQHLNLGMNVLAAGNGTTTDYSTITKQMLEYYAEKGFKDIRIPITWEQIQPVQGGPIDTKFVAQMQQVITDAKALGENVILDIHNYGAAYGNVIGSAGTPISSFADLWGKLAADFKDDTNVKFGLMNEPYQLTAEQWLPAINAAIGAIRGAGAGQEILVSGAGWDGAANWTTSDTLNTIAGHVVDPANNFAYEVHQYLDDTSGQHDWVVSDTIGVERLTAITQWAEATGSKLYLGEFGVADNQPSLTALDNMLSYMQQHTDVWTGGTYFAGGPAWNWQDYIFSVEPTLGIFDQGQMAVLDKYTGATKVTTALADGSKQIDTFIPGDTNPTIRDLVSKDGMLVSRTLYNLDGTVMKTATFDGTNYTVTTYTQGSIAKTIEVYDKSALAAADPIDAVPITRTTIDASGNKTVDHMKDAYNISVEEKYDAAGKLVSTLVNQNGQHIATNYSATGALANQSIFKDGANYSWVLVKTTTYDANGKISVIQAELDNGNHQKDSYDANGHMTKSDLYTSNWQYISTTAYATTVPTAVSVAAQVLAHDTGKSVTDKVTNDGHVTLNGTVSTNSGTIVKIMDGSTVLGNATLDGKGGWTFSADLGAGNHALKAVVTDSTGTTVSTSLQSSVTVDKSAPTVSVDSIAAALVKGSAEAGSTVKVYDGTNLLGSVTADSSGKWQMATNFAVGTHTIKAVAADIAGNETTSSNTALTVPAPTIVNVASQVLAHDTGASATDKITNDGHVTLNGTVSNNSGTAVKIMDGATVIGSVTLDGKGNWSFATDLASGTHNLKAAVTDSTGASATSGTQAAITVDKAAPGVGVSSYTKDGASTLVKGIAEAGASVKIMDGSTVLGTVKADTNGQWSLSSPLAIGNHAVHAEATDIAGNTTSSAAMTVKVAMPTSVSTDTQILAHDTGISAADRISNDGHVTLTGKVSTNDATSVKIYDGSTVLGSATLDNKGGWTFSTVLGEGTHGLKAVVSDSTGNSNASAVQSSITVDSSAPSVAIASYMKDGNATLIKGTAEANATVKVFDGGTVIGSTTANANGQWSYSANLNVGTHAVYATATDVAGNTAASGNATVKVAMPTSVQIDAQILAHDTGASAADKVTNDGHVTLSGKVSTNDTTTVKIYDGSIVLGAAVLDGKGNWSFATDLTSGTHNLKAVATDWTGTSAMSAVQASVSVDKAAPTVLISSYSKDGDAMFIKGTGEAGATVKLLDGATVLGTATVGSNGQWSYNADLKTGTHSVVAMSTDIAGNTATTGITTIKIAMPVVVTVDTQTIHDTGASASDRVTNDGHVSLSGTVSTNDATSVKIYDGATVLGSATLDNKGGWKFDGDLAEGTHNLKAVATDSTGTVVASNVQPEVTVDKTAPNVGISSFAKDGGDTVFKGTAEAGANVKISDGALVLGTATANADGQWEVRFALANGSHDVKAMATDIAGNSAASADAVFATGQDKLVLKISEDAYLDNAKFTVSVDGVQIGGTYEATAIRKDGQTQNLTLNGDFGAGNHVVMVDFLNDAYKGTNDTDRNLFVKSIAFNDTETTFDSAQWRAGNVDYKVTSAADDEALIYGGANDTVHGNSAANIIFGGAGSDVLYGHSGDDSLYGGLSNDVLYGGDGNDYLSGGAGNDTLYGGAGSNIAVFSGSVNDYSIVFRQDGSIELTDKVTGRDGTDYIYNIDALLFQNGLTQVKDIHMMQEVIKFDGNWNIVGADNVSADKTGVLTLHFDTPKTGDWTISSADKVVTTGDTTMTYHFATPLTGDWTITNVDMVKQTNNGTTTTHLNSSWSVMGSEDSVKNGNTTTIKIYDAAHNMVSSEVDVVNDSKTTMTHYDAAGKTTGSTVILNQTNGSVLTENLDKSGKLITADLQSTEKDGGTLVQHFDSSWKFQDAVKTITSGGDTQTYHFDSNWKITASEVTKAPAEHFGALDQHVPADVFSHVSAALASNYDDSNHLIAQSNVA